MGQRGAEQVKALATKPDKMSQIPRLHTEKGRTDEMKLSSPPRGHTMAYTGEEANILSCATSVVGVGAHLQLNYSATQMTRNTQFTQG